MLSATRNEAINTKLFRLALFNICSSKRRSPLPGNLQTRQNYPTDQLSLPPSAGPSCQLLRSHYNTDTVNMRLHNGKAKWKCPATRQGGAWGERRYSSYSFLTSALEGAEWSASRPGRPLPPVPTVQEAGWDPEPVWTQRLEEKSSASVEDRTPVVRSVVRHCTDWATPAHNKYCNICVWRRSRNVYVSQFVAVHTHTAFC
jgi:hypothetical protein